MKKKILLNSRQTTRVVEKIGILASHPHWGRFAGGGLAGKDRFKIFGSFFSKLKSVYKNAPYIFGPHTERFPSGLRLGIG